MSVASGYDPQPLFDITNVKNFALAKFTTQPHLGTIVFENSKSLSSGAISTCSTPVSNSNTTRQWLVVHVVAGSSPAQIKVAYFLTTSSFNLNWLFYFSRTRAWQIAIIAGGAVVILSETRPARHEFELCRGGSDSNANAHVL